MYIHSFFSAPLYSLIMSHLWLSSHDEYSEIHEDPNLLITSHSTVHTKLLSKCTSIHSSLHPCLPLSWIISDCLLMMSIRRHTQTTATTYKSFHCTELCCCLNVHPFVLLCTLVFPYYKSSLIVFSCEYSEIHEDPNLLITSHSTVHM